MTGMRKFKLARQTTTGPAAPTPIAVQVEVQPTTATDPISAAMDQATINLPRLLTPQTVAEMLGVTERTLERWRITGEGPRYAKLSRSSVRYQHEDVAGFIADRLRANTAQ